MTEKVQAKRRVFKMDERASYDTVQKVLNNYTKSLPDAVVDDDITGTSIISPPITYAVLERVSLEAPAFRPCLDAMIVNIDSFGYHMKHIGGIQDEELLPDKDKKELERLLALFDYPNPVESFTALRKKARRDLEVFGNAFIEIVRNIAGEIIFINYVPARNMRLVNYTKSDTISTKFVAKRQNSSGDLADMNIETSRKFRRYVQIAGAKKVYFKEFGCPKELNSTTGRYGNTTSGATELIHLKIGHNTISPYGTPRWVGAILGMIGSKKAETLNYNYFENNSIPPLAILVSGGQLNQESIDELHAAFRGKKELSQFWRAVVLEAVSDSIDEKSSGATRIDIKELNDSRLDDALFEKYIASINLAVRVSFRLPPIFIGDSSDYTRATADSSKRVVETQVFSPERRDFDEVVNYTIMRELGIENWVFRSKAPRLVDIETLIQAIKAFDQVGAATPNQIIDLANEYLGTKTQKIDSEWGDLPFALTQKLLQVKQNMYKFGGSLVEGESLNQMAEGISTDDIGLQSIQGGKKDE